MSASVHVDTAPPGATRSCDPQSQLFARYVKALALLCECQPYVDEPDYEAQLEAVLREACAADGIEMRHVDGRFEIALDVTLRQEMAILPACAS